MATKLQEREAFRRIMARECPRATGQQLGELITLAQRHHRIAERECNGHRDWQGNWDEAAAKRDEAACERVEKRVRAICEAIGCTPIFSGDPRGCTIKLRVPSGFSDSWGGEGVCVPT